MTFEFCVLSYTVPMAILGDFFGFLRGKKKDESAPDAGEAAVMEQFNQGVSNLRDVLAPAGFRLAPKFFEIDGKWATTIFVTTYPRYLDTNWFAPIVNFDIEFDAADRKSVV